MSDSSMKTTGISLANIPELEAPEQWPNWYREIEEYLTLSGYSYIIDNDTAPDEGSATQRATAVATFKEQTIRATAAFRNRCGYNATSLAAINEERRIASEQSTSQMLVATRISGNKATIQVDYCRVQTLQQVLSY